MCRGIDKYFAQFIIWACGGRAVIIQLITLMRLGLKILSVAEFHPKIPVAVSIFDHLIFHCLPVVTLS
jgi:hypothetical protein